MSNLNFAREALMNDLANWMPAMERKTLMSSLKGEEGEVIASVVMNIVAQIAAAPVTYATEGLEEKIAALHYFKGACDWYIIEKDVEGGVQQAYGYANLGDPDCAEYGYISITELVQNGVELDLYWTPKPMSELVAR